MSKTNSSLHADHQLDQLAGQFEHWRQHRSPQSERIPKALGDQAATLAQGMPYTRGAKPLHLSGRDLKDHRAELYGKTSTPSSSPPPFVEVRTAPTWPPAAGAMEVELDRPDGARLRLRCTESPSPVAALVRAFWEGVR
jgi:hypothetical protein